MKIRTIFLSTIAAMFCVSLQAAEKIAPAKSAWAGPQIETKTKAAVAATALTKKTDLVRALEVMYGAEFDEQEQRLKPAVREGVKVDETTQVLQKITYASQPLYEHVLKIISDYVPEFHYFTPAREFAVPRLAPAHHTPSGTCASFIDKDGKRVYVVPCEQARDKAYFILLDEKGTEIGRSSEHVNKLTQVIAVPDEVDEKTKQEKYCSIITSSEDDDSLSFWDKAGKYRYALDPFRQAECSICDFDIVTEASINGKDGYLIALIAAREQQLRVYHLLSKGTTYVYTIPLWGNLGAEHVRLISTQHGFKVVTYEENMPGFKKDGALCCYGLASRQIELRIPMERTVTSMECIAYDEDHTLLLAGDLAGTVHGYLIPYAPDFLASKLKEKFIFKIPFGKEIIALKVYNDALDDDCLHVIVKTADNALYDFNIRTEQCETVISPSKNKHYMGLGSDKNGRTTLLTCADGVVCEWEKDTDPFNSLYEKPIKEPKQIRVTPQVSDASAGNPASCTCIVM